MLLECCFWPCFFFSPITKINHKHFIPFCCLLFSISSFSTGINFSEFFVFSFFFLSVHWPVISITFMFVLSCILGERNYVHIDFLTATKGCWYHPSWLLPVCPFWWPSLYCISSPLSFFERHEDRSRNTEVFHLQVASPEAQNKWAWPRLKPRAQDIVQVSHMGGSNPSTWPAITSCCPHVY